MTTTIESAATTIRTPRVGFEVDEAQLAAISFPARYSGRTLEAYRHDLRGFFQWATDQGIAVLAASRAHIDLFRACEACATNIEDLGIERGHRTLRIVGKGNKPATVPLVPRTARTIDLAVGERHEGPILRRRDGQRLDRRTAHR
jgi:site-specific recombinase XerC